MTWKRLPNELLRFRRLKRYNTKTETNKKTLKHKHIMRLCRKTRHSVCIYLKWFFFCCCFFPILTSGICSSRHTFKYKHQIHATIFLPACTAWTITTKERFYICDVQRGYKIPIWNLTLFCNVYIVLLEKILQY